MQLQMPQIHTSMMLVPRGPLDETRGPLPEDTARTSILIALLILAVYMSFLIDLKVITIFKRRTTLYFWSLLVTSWGIIGHSLGVFLKWFIGSCPWVVFTAFSSFGWWAMVTGQSLVLYSRLHLVVRNDKVLRAVLIMIIVNFFLFQVPTTLLKFICTAINTPAWLKVYQIYERIQLAVFTLQELIISTIYIRAAVRWLSPSHPEGMRRIKHFLIYLNLFCIALDVAIACEVYSGDWIYEEATQSLAYATKLTLEFAVLNQVMEVHSSGLGSSSRCRCGLTTKRHQPIFWCDISPKSETFPSSATITSRTTRGTPWPQLISRGVERVRNHRGQQIADGPVKTEIVIEEEQIEPITPSTSLTAKDARQNIVITTGITTHFEARRSTNGCEFESS